MPNPESDPQMLSLDQAQALALELMDQHGLLDNGWRFRWSNAKRAMGSASIRKSPSSRTGSATEVKTLALSRFLVKLNPASEVRDTILHEIAHALAGIEHGHDHVWKAACRKIGAEPKRLASEEVRFIQPRYAIRCLSCDQVVGERHRRVASHRLSEAHCRACGPQSTGQLRLVDLGESIPPTASG